MLDARIPWYGAASSSLSPSAACTQRSRRDRKRCERVEEALHRHPESVRIIRPPVEPALVGRVDEIEDLFVVTAALGELPIVEPPTDSSLTA